MQYRTIIGVGASAITLIASTFAANLVGRDGRHARAIDPGPRTTHARDGTVALDTALRRLHSKLFTALDRAEEDRVREILSPNPILYVLDHDERPLELSGAYSANSLVSLWARGTEDPAPTGISTFDVIALSPTLAVVTLRIERPTDDVPWSRVTSVVTTRKTDDGVENRICHLHLSPATRTKTKGT